MSYIRNEFERGGVRSLRICREDTEGFECESALKSDLLDALYEAIPIANVELAAGQIGVGDHMEVVVRVVVVDVEDGQTLAHYLHIILEVKVAEVSVTDIKAEAEVIAARFLVENVDHSCGVIGIRKSCLDKV